MYITIVKRNIRLLTDYLVSTSINNFERALTNDRGVTLFFTLKSIVKLLQNGYAEETATLINSREKLRIFHCRHLLLLSILYFLLSRTFIKFITQWSLQRSNYYFVKYIWFTRIQNFVPSIISICLYFLTSMSCHKIKCSVSF